MIPFIVVLDMITGCTDPYAYMRHVNHNSLIPSKVYEIMNSFYRNVCNMEHMNPSMCGHKSEWIAIYQDEVWF